MKTHFLTVLFLSCLLTSSLAQTPWTPAEIIKYKRVSSPALSEDGRLVAYTVATARMEGETSDFLTHIYVVSTDGKINAQFTFGDKSCTNPQFSPDGQYLSYTSARGKDGKNQLYLLRLSGGEAWPITTVKENIGTYQWAPDSKRLAFTMAEPLTDQEEKGRKERRDWSVVDDFRNAHLYTVSLAKDEKGQYPVKRLTKGAFHVTMFDWAPDGKAIAFAHQPSAWINFRRDNDIYTVPADSGTVQLLVASKGMDTNPVYSPDSRSIAYVSDGGITDHTRKDEVYIIPAVGGIAQKLNRTPDDSPLIVGWTPDSRSVLIQEALGSQTGFYLLSAAGGALSRWTVPEKGIAYTFMQNRKGDMVYLYETPETPTEVYLANLTSPTGRKLTNIHSDFLKGKTHARTELVSWKAKDGKYTIEGLLTYPANYQPGRKYPLMLNVHGGPAGVFAQTYTAGIAAYPIQAFAQKGYFVLRPNPRGSTGYGAEFRMANYRDWGNNDYEDLMAGVDKVIDMGLAHPDSLVGTGWSYGGYMTANIITKTNRFKAVMAGAAVTNLVSLNGTTDVPNHLVFYFGGDFWDDQDVYNQHSPMSHIKKAKTPTLVIHGMADDRVPPEQGFQLHRGLQRLGVPTQMVTYPRQAHGFTEPKFMQDVWERTIEWFNLYLGRKTAASGLTSIPKGD